jgi:phosphohistidine phosphatase
VRRLHLLRHAKSSWDDPTLADHDRPLAKRGRRACELVAEHLRGERIEPELVLCSSALRTRETLERIAPAIGDAEVRVEQDLYGANAGRLLERLREIPDEVTSAMLIGHNPAMQELALTLARADGEVAQMRAKFPTAALATFELEVSWGELAPGTGSLLGFVKPKQLERG